MFNNFTFGLIITKELLKILKQPSEIYVGGVRFDANTCLKQGEQQTVHQTT